MAMCLAMTFRISSCRVAAKIVAADEGALVLQQDLQPVPRDRGRAPLGEQAEEAHATRLPNSRLSKPLFSPWIVIGTVSPRSRLAASE